jgi:hypothetical protein
MDVFLGFSSTIVHGPRRLGKAKGVAFLVDENLKYEHDERRSS